MFNLRKGIPSCLYVERPLATNYKGLMYITDMGINGSLWYSNGIKWTTPAGIVGSSNYAGWIVPSMLSANAATYSQTGTTITVTGTAHGLPSTKNGYNIYLAPGSGLATAGWYSNFTYVNANTFTCTSPVSQSTSGSILTNLNNVTIDACTVTHPAGLFLNSGGIYVSAQSMETNSANIKRLNVNTDSAAWVARVLASISGKAIDRRLIFKGGNQQISGLVSGAADPSGSSVAKYTLDEAGVLVTSIEMGCAAALEYIALDYADISIYI